jgi:hypothetical protein
MTTWRRLLGYVDDATAGGKSYDDLAAGAIPDANKFVAVTEADVDMGDNRLERNTEIRGYRGSPPPIEFQANPKVSFTSIAYPHLTKKLVRLWTGGTDARTGTPPAAITHLLEAIQSGDLPAVHLGVVRDEKYDKVAGCTLNQLTLDFPLADHATLAASFNGKYMIPNVGTAPPAAAYTEYPRRGYLLRDAKVYLDGSITQIPALAGIRFVLDNRMADPPDFFPGENVVVTTYDGVKRRIWWPERHKFMSHAITGQIMFSEPKPDEDLKRELAHAESIVLECSFEDIDPPTTPPAVEMLRVTGSQMVRTGGGAEGLQKEAAINSSYDFGLFVDEATGDDAKFEFTDGSNTNIT